MSVTAQNIIDRARSQLIDTGSTKRWSDAELLQWLSDGQREIVSLLPDASAQIAIVALIPGTRQVIPSNGVMLLNVTRNISADGTISGRSVPITSRELLDSYDLNWSTAFPAKVVQSYIFDPEQMTTFYVYPPNDGQGHLEINYSVLPALLNTTADNIGLADMFAIPLVDYVLYRAHQKDSDFAAGQSVSQNYYQLFLLGLGLDEQSKGTADPNMKEAAQ